MIEGDVVHHCGARLHRGLASGRIVAVAGVDGLVVVDTPDAVLVVPRDRSQLVKEVVEQLQAAGRDELLLDAETGASGALRMSADDAEPDQVRDRRMAGRGRG